MRYSYSALVLATVAIAQVAAGPVRHGHAHFHEKKNLEALTVEETIEKREPQDGVDWANVHYTYSEGQTWGEPTPAAPVVAAATAPAAAVVPAATSAVAAVASAVASTVASTVSAGTILLAADLARLNTLGAQVGINSQTNNGKAWIGDDGAYVHEFINASGEDIIAVVWGEAGSWVNAQAPLVTHSLPVGSSTKISFASGYSGAFAALYPDTALVNGQVSQTWGEYTHSVEGVVDVSREVNMNGRPLTIVGPTCTTSLTQCVFVCSSGTSCEFDYLLQNCDPATQPGAQFGTYAGSDSGGCGGMGAAATFTTTFA